MRLAVIPLLVFSIVNVSVIGFGPPHPKTISTTTTTYTSLYVVEQKQRQQSSKETQKNNPNEIEQTTKKYGLEVGLTQALQQKDGGETAKSLLKKYGIAYLATSIPLALISFGLCYILVDQGVNVSEILAKVGIETTQNSATDQAGTLALAYAAHKAASPIRFPPTVLLTPMVAKWIGKEPATDEEQDGDE
jgi:Protein of unknown function (DUF1279)